MSKEVIANTVSEKNNQVVHTVPFLSGKSSSAFAINSEQSPREQVACLNGFAVSDSSFNSACVRTSRNTAPGSAAADLTSSGVLNDAMLPM